MDKKREDVNKNNQPEDSKSKQTSSFIEKIKASLNRLFRSKEVKRYTFVTLCAIMIGLIFGFTTLKVLNHVGQPEDVGAVSTVNVDDNGKTDVQADNLINKKLSPLQAYVVQGGVFSDEANLNEWKQLFNAKGFKVVEWNREELSYLFIGLSGSESKLSDLKQQIINSDLDAYVKVWETKEHEISLEETDIEWIETFIGLWEKSLQQIDENGPWLEEDWNKLIAIDMDQSPELETFQQQVKAVFDESSTESRVEQQFALLSLWQLLEQYIILN